MRQILRILAALADPVRLRALRLLRGRELCVCELMDVLRLPQYAVSRHLRVLRAAGLVQARRSGRWMHYRLRPMVRRGQGVGRLVDSLCQELRRVPDGRRDDARLAQRLRLRRSGVCVVGITGPCKSNANGVLRGGTSTKLRRGLAADRKI
jgi:ArsR family transcriptional regulator, arsenate/arsenite/antimonite-responsive transcriptional repressor